MYFHFYIHNYKCTYFLVVTYAHKYISHFRKHICIYIYHIYIYIYILYIHIYLCLDNLIKLTCRGMLGSSPFFYKKKYLATLADNGARTKEHRAQRTKGAKTHQLPKGGATF